MQVYRRTVAGEYYLLAVAEEMVEDMEEGVDGSFSACSEDVDDSEINDKISNIWLS